MTSMASGGSKPTDEFESPTHVMKSGLLRVLTKQSAEPADLEVDVTVETELPPVTDAPPRVVPPIATTAAGEIGTAQVAVPSPRRKQSNAIVGVAIVAAFVLAAGASIFVVRGHAARIQPPPPAPSLPTYMVLPEASPPPEHVVVPAAPEIKVMPAEPPKPRTHAHHHRRR
jgi:hypothetical protein